MEESELQTTKEREVSKEIKEKLILYEKEAVE